MQGNCSEGNFLLFGLKVTWIKDSFENIIWTNPSPNSPFAMRPVALLALCESEENVKFLMDTTINTETQILQSTGVQLKEGKVNFNIQMKDIELIKQGIPINRSIDSAIEIFAEVDEDDFFLFQVMKDLV